MRSLVAAVLSAALLVAAGCSKPKQPSEAIRKAPASQAVQKAQPGSTTAAAGSVPSQKQLYLDMIEKGVTPERAKQLFSMVVGPLPGVAVASSERDLTDFDGTLAVGYLYRVWSTLTPEQRQAAYHLIELGQIEARPMAPGPAKPRPPSRNGAAKHASLPANDRPRLVLAAYSSGMVDIPAFDYEKLAETANLTLAAFLGNIQPVSVVVEVGYGPPFGTEYAHTFSWYHPYDSPDLPWIPYVGGCHITIWNQKFLPLDQATAAAVVTHEMFHCYQQRQAGSAEVDISVPGWIVEGEATWAMAVVVPAGSDVVDAKWTRYRDTPQQIYIQRSQDALGVFGHMSDVAGDAVVWPRLLPMVTAGAGGDNVTAFGLLIAGHETTYYTTWGSSYFETPSNQPWRMNGPGSPPTTGPPPEMVSVSGGNDVVITVGPDQAKLTQANTSEDIVLVSLMTGYGRLHDDGFAIDTALDSSGQLGLCFKGGGCKCPDGTPGASLITKLAKAPVSIGSDGGETTAQIALVASSLDKFCKKPDQTPSAPLAPGGGGGGWDGGGGNDNPKQPYVPPEGATYGDTHITTFDGLHYDLQVVGEFTLVRSTKDDFLVQVRQVPAVGSREVSINRAVATKLGRDTISVTMEKTSAVLRIDGKIVSGALPALKGGTLTRSSNLYGDVYQLTWPDGTVVRAEQSGGLALNVRVRPAASRRGTLVGLLGDADGSAENDLVGLQKAHLGMRPSDADVNHSLADAWRITQAKSLLDYDPGQSAATFVDRNFPAKLSDPSKVANRAAAEKYCQELQITEPHLLENCILDLAVTNDFVFGSQYAHAQQVLAARAALAGPLKTSSEKPATLIMTGEILDSKSEPAFQFKGKKGDVIWLHDPDCTDKLPQFHPVFLRLFGPDGKPVDPSGQGCQFGRRELPFDGAYTFQAKFMYRNEIVKYRIPIRFVRADRHMPLKYGQTVSGNIEQRAAHDVYTFTGNAGDVIAISGAGCDLGSMLLGIIDSAGHDIGGVDCRMGSDLKLPQTGTYQLLMNSWDGGPATYRFVFQGGAFK